MIGVSSKLRFSERFSKWPKSIREKILKTLSTVRIHIVDPRPYTVGLNDALRKVLPKGTTVSDFLRRLDAATQHLKQVRAKSLESIARRILHDSPGERLKGQYKAWERANGMHREAIEAFDIRTPTKPAPTTEFDLTPFYHPNANMLNDVANFVSASASVFTSALDQFQEAQIDSFLTAPMAAPWLINNALSRSHAYDDGQSAAVKWVEQQRIEVLSSLDRDKSFYPASTPEPLQELVSTDSVQIQAADIAASIAREFWSRNNLPYLVRQFSYVTYNGQKLSEDQASTYETILRTHTIPN
jgi:hypothetical protein